MARINQIAARIDDLRIAHRSLERERSEAVDKAQQAVFATFAPRIDPVAAEIAELMGERRAFMRS